MTRSLFIFKSSRVPLSFLLAGAAPLVAYSQVFLSEEQAVKVLFPDQKLGKKLLELTADEERTVAEKSGQLVRTRVLKAWVGPHKEVVLIDEVLGKHEFITYAVGFGTDGTIKGVEILVYREAYGQQVAGEAWRKQFLGKSLASPLKINHDIKNISGATLSSAHVTAGVKRLLHSFECVRERI